ncbi:hypothetical protein P3T76_015921 [Phytophthora citrophthora]|uniref:Uncharacterized protein n=1 Tax=Phytophthora citrophthora TaxID=4793 RepID=A0AAD9FYJ7_9STRA|nr:hypothetical protein P3T76_015921 [Phytophthora citrophthora]
MLLEEIVSVVVISVYLPIIPVVLVVMGSESLLPLESAVLAGVFSVDWFDKNARIKQYNRDNAVKMKMKVL